MSCPRIRRRRVALAWRRVEMPTSKPRQQKLKGLLSLLTGGAALAGILIGLVGWTTNFLRPTALVVDSPSIVEFRCSTSSIASNRCEKQPTTNSMADLSADIPDASIPHALSPRTAMPSLSVTAAFRIQAQGSSSNAATLIPASAVVKFPAVANFDAVRLELTAYWSGSLIPGKNVALTQVVPRAMKHGEILHQEIWFMPLTSSCADTGVIGCADERSGSFMDWWAFREQIMKRANAVHNGEASLSESSIMITFKFRYQSSTGIGWLFGWAPELSKPNEVQCAIELTRSHFDIAADSGFVSHSVRCNASA